MDVNRLSRGERIAGVAAVLLIVDMFLNWYSANLNSTGTLAAGIVIILVAIGLAIYLHKHYAEEALDDEYPDINHLDPRGGGGVTF